MSQKMQTEKINGVFNPSDFGVRYCENFSQQQALDKEKKKKEDELYNEIVEGLRSDRTDLGIERTYSCEILIREVALNILMMNRLKYDIICTPLMRQPMLWKKEHVTYKRQPYSERFGQSISYEKYPGNEEMHPLFEGFLFKLEKQIRNGLKDLGLLPVQQIERQKLVIIKKLRQKYECLGGEISVEARQEQKKVSRKPKVNC